MKNHIVKDLKKYIRLNLEDRIYQIVSNADKVRLLSKRDLISIANFMKEERIYSISMLEYIYTKSIHRYSSELSLPNIDNGILIYAAIEGNFDIIKLLLSNKIRVLFPNIDPSTANNYPIRYASLGGHLDVVKFLLSNEIRTLFPNIDPCASNNYSIRYASKNGHLDVVKFLLSSEVVALFPNIDPSADDNFAIKIASLKGNLDVVKFLLSY